MYAQFESYYNLICHLRRKAFLKCKEVFKVISYNQGYMLNNSHSIIIFFLYGLIINVGLDLENVPLSVF